MDDSTNRTLTYIDNLNTKINILYMLYSRNIRMWYAVYLQHKNAYKLRAKIACERIKQAT